MLALYHFGFHVYITALLYLDNHNIP